MLFHKDIGIPKTVLEVIPTSFKRLVYTEHAIDRFVERSKNNTFRLPQTIKFGKSNIYEVSVKNEKIEKILIRTIYDLDRDLIMVLCPIKGGKAIVKTVWTNKRGEKTNLKNYSKYDKLSESLMIEDFILKQIEYCEILEKTF